MGLVVFINGAFGVGKTTLARTLRDAHDGFAIFDPEKIGSVLRRLPTVLPLSTKRLDDYQDSPVWRSIAARFADFRARRSRVLLIPMTITDLAYLNEIRSYVEDRGHQSLHLCLTASVDVIYQRLAQRGLEPGSKEGRWVYPRAGRACELHRSAEFAIHISTDSRNPRSVADEAMHHIEMIAY